MKPSTTYKVWVNNGSKATLRGEFPTRFAANTLVDELLEMDTVAWVQVVYPEKK